MDYRKYLGKKVRVLFLNDEAIEVETWVELYLLVIKNAFTKAGGNYKDIQKVFKNPSGERKYLFNTDINKLAKYRTVECFTTNEGIVIYADINNSTPKKLRNLDYIYTTLNLKEDWDFQFKADNTDYKTKEKMNLSK